MLSGDREQMWLQGLGTADIHHRLNQYVHSVLCVFARAVYTVNKLMKLNNNWMLFKYIKVNY